MKSRPDFLGRAGLLIVVGLVATGVCVPAAHGGPHSDISYEKITPDEKNGQGAIPHGTIFDADHIYYQTTGSIFPTDPAGGVSGLYFGSRLSDGWSSQATFLTSGSNAVWDFNSDYSQGIVVGQTPMTADDLDAFRDVYTSRGSSLERVSTGSVGGNGPFGALYTGGSRDGTHILFSTTEVLEPGDVGRNPDVPQLYEHVGGSTRLVGVNSGGVPLSPGGAVLAPGAVGLRGGYAHPVSEDGSRIFLQAPCPGNALTPDFGLCPDPPASDPTQVYVREDNGVQPVSTVQVSASECNRTAPDPPCIDPQPAMFLGASRTGDIVYFMTSGQLTNGDTDIPDPIDLDVGNDLYQYRVDTHELQRVSGGPSDSVTGAAVEGVAGLSDDGLRVYFTAKGVLAPNAVQGESNLYLYDAHDSTTRFIATLSPGETSQNLNVSGPTTPNKISISRDGGTLVFPTRASVTSFDATSPACGGGRCLEFFRYQVASDKVTCVSCNTSARPPLGDVFWGQRANSGLPGTAPAAVHANELVSGDGSAVVFTTMDKLAQEDTNGQLDVYLWREGEGVSLLTTGRSSSPSYAVGTTEDGQDFFLTTYDQLIPQDRDPYTDLYVATTRPTVGRPPVAEAPPCFDDGCQGKGSGAPLLSVPESDTFRGSGDVNLGSRRVVTLARTSKAQRRRFARTGHLDLIARVNGPGRLAAVARARVGGMSKIVGRASKRMADGGRTTLRLELSKDARRELRRMRTLRVSVLLTFADARNVMSVVALTLARKGK